MYCTPWKTQLVSGHSAFALSFLLWCLLSPSHPQTIVLILEEIGKVNTHMLLTRGDWCQGWKRAIVQVTAKERDFLKNAENIRYYYWCIFQEVYFEKKNKPKQQTFTAIQLIATLWKYLVTLQGKKSPPNKNPNKQTKTKAYKNLETFKVSKPFSKKKSESSASWTKGLYIGFALSIKIRQKA